MITFARQEKPLLLHVIKEKSFHEAKVAMMNGRLAGARGYDLHLSTITDEMTEEAFRGLVDATDKPIMVLDYNQDYYGKQNGLTDEQRMERFMIAVRGGVSCVDMQGYTFECGKTNESLKNEAWQTEGMSFISGVPDEVTINPETVKKQMEYIDRVHAEGAEVLISIHTHKYLNFEQMCDLYRFVDKRGADIIKVVGECNTDDELAEVMKTIINLKNLNTNARLHYHCNGKYGKLTRVTAPLFGSYMMFCNCGYTYSSHLAMPDLKTMSDAYDGIEKMIK